MQMMTWMKITKFLLRSRMPVSASTEALDESVFDVKIKKNNAVADAFLGFKILYNWPAVGWIKAEVVERNIDCRMKIGSGIVNFFVFYMHDDDTSKHSAQSEQLQLDLQGLLTLPGYSRRRKRHEEDKGGVDAIYLAFFYCQ